MKRREIRIGVRSGVASDTKTNGTRPVKVVVISGGPNPLLWLGGAKEHDGLAWVAGRGTLLRIRDALSEVLEPSSVGEGEKR